MKNFLKRLLHGKSGSVLMEFVIVMPLYITALGATFWIGYKSLDAINLRPAANWGVWSANRYSSRPGPSCIEFLFPRGATVTNNLKRSLKNEKSYLEFVGNAAKIEFEKPEYIENWQESSNVMYGEADNWDIKDDDDTMTSSNQDNDFTEFLVMRTKGSIRNIRLLDASLLAENRYWEKNATTEDYNEYPDEWEEDLLDNAKHTDDNFTDSKAENDTRTGFYDRYSTYEKWSKKK